MANDILKYLKKHGIFSTFNEELLSIIAKDSKVINIEKHQYIIHEKEAIPQYLFLVLTGTIGFFKSDENDKEELLLTRFTKDEVFGETSAFSPGASSFNIQALDSSKILMIPLSIIQNFEQSKELKKHYADVIKKLSELLTQKLDFTYKSYFNSLKEEKYRKHLQKESNLFLIGTCILFGLGMTMDHIVTMYYIDIKSIWFNWVYLFVILVPIVLFIFAVKCPLRTFGVTLKNFWPSLKLGLFISGTLWLFGIFGVSVQSEDVDLPFYSHVIGEISKKIPLSYVSSYIVHSYIQEFVARGVIQTTLQRFLEDERGFKANILTSSLFAVFHVHRGFEAVALTFLASLFFGWIYLRDRNLVGVSLTHWSMGTISRLMGGF